MIVQADAGRLPYADGSVHALVTSPPYWGGLRQYDGEHQGRPWPAISYVPIPGLPPVEIPAQTVELGHEPDPFAFVGHLLQVFREGRRVLRPDGVAMLNYGDCMSTGKGVKELGDNQVMLMTWRLALAMQADGWILRSRMPGGLDVDKPIEPDILWKKASCMPESVRDRPTRDFEDVLIFSQRSSYFWDQEAGREEYSLKTAPELPAYVRHDGVRTVSTQTGGVESSGLGKNTRAAGRNMRCTWTINPEPTDEEHFAAFPTELAARLIRVATSEKGCCPECGAQWERVVDRQRCLDGVPRDDLGSWATGEGAPTMGAQGVGHWRYETKTSTLGWKPACDHGLEPVRCTILDPFAGLGRTWEACRQTGRRFLGADLGLGYCRLALSRNDLEAMERRRTAEQAKTITGPLFP